jgi:hypothetical protein
MGIETRDDSRHHLRLNPDVVENVDLPGLDEIGVVVVQIQPLWSRCLEQLALHVFGSGVTAAIVFVVGVLFSR